MFLRKCFLFSLCLFFPVMKILAQEVTMEQTIAFINKKLGSQCTLEVSHGIINAKYYKPDGTLYREDKVSTKELDYTKIRFEPEEKVLYVSCKDKYDECVDRQLYITKVHGHYSRLSFVVNPDPKTIESMTKAFSYLIRFATDSKFKTNDPLE